MSVSYKLTQIHLKGKQLMMKFIWTLMNENEIHLNLNEWILVVEYLHVLESLHLLEHLRIHLL